MYIYIYIMCVCVCARARARAYVLVCAYALPSLFQKLKIKNNVWVCMLTMAPSAPSPLRTSSLKI